MSWIRVRIAILWWSCSSDQSREGRGRRGVEGGEGEERGRRGGGEEERGGKEENERERSKAV